MILLVEDNIDDEALALRTLRKNVPHAVMVVRDGAEAIDFLFAAGAYQGRDLSTSPSLILLDLKLPKMSGVEVLRRIRSDARTSNIPVVIFTSSTEVEDIMDCCSLGASSYVCKPVDFREYSEALQQVTAYWLSCEPLSAKPQGFERFLVGRSPLHTFGCRWPCGRPACNHGSACLH